MHAGLPSFRTFMARSGAAGSFAVGVMLAGCMTASAQSPGTVYSPSIGGSVIAPVHTSPVTTATLRSDRDLSDICAPGNEHRFWTIRGCGTIQQWEIMGDTIVGGDTILQAPAIMNSIAYSNFSGPMTFHVTPESGSVISQMAYYDSDQDLWIDELTYNGSALHKAINNGGMDRMLYYQMNDGQIPPTTVMRMAANETPQLIATAYMTIADLAVTNAGTVFFTNIVNGELRMMEADSTGTILSNTPMFNTDPTGRYGSFMIGDTMFVGRIVTNDIQPWVIHRNQSIEVLDSIPFDAHNISNCDVITDLTNCHPHYPAGIHDRIPEAAWNVWPVPADADLTIDIPRFSFGKVTAVQLMDASGREVAVHWRMDDRKILVTGLGAARDGVYYVRVRSALGESHGIPLLVRHHE